MTEVERFFRRLVSTLASTDPARLQGPLPLDDITGSILPYRAHRRALGLDTVEDYEAVLLRLCAGEGDLVWTEPEEARARFVAELRSPHPDLTALYAFENVVLTFRPEPLLWALAPAPEPRPEYQEPDARAADPEPTPQVIDTEEEAPPEPVIVLGAAQYEAEPEPEAEPETEEIEGPAAPTCLYCGGSLPTNRQVNFCPHCGQSQTRILCPECRNEVEQGWRHCVNCGAAVGE